MGAGVVTGVAARVHIGLRTANPAAPAAFSFSPVLATAESNSFADGGAPGLLVGLLRPSMLSAAMRPWRLAGPASRGSAPARR